MKNKTYIYFTMLVLLASAALTGCDNEAKGQAEGDVLRNFLQDIISGSVSEDQDSNGLILMLEVMPQTAFIDEDPELSAGSITTENFIKGFPNGPGEVNQIP